MYNTYIRKVAVSMKNDEKIDIVLDEISEEELSADHIIPDAFDPRVRVAISKAVADAAKSTGVAEIG